MRKRKNVQIEILKSVLSDMDRSDLEKYALHAIGALISTTTAHAVNATLLAKVLSEDENAELERVSQYVADEVQRRTQKTLESN